MKMSLPKQTPMGGGGGLTADDLTADAPPAVCLVCVEPARTPVQLDCGHAFCGSCLHFYCRVYDCIKREQQGLFVPCPTCGRLTRLPDDGLENLATGGGGDKTDGGETDPGGRKISQGSDGLKQCSVCVFKAHTEEACFYCNKCSMYFCETCRLEHDMQPLFKTHQVIHVANKENIHVVCETHSQLPSRYFCMDCDVPICTVCILHQHASHHTAHLTEALSQRRDNLRTLLNQLGPKLDKIEGRLKKLTHMCSLQAKRRNGWTDSPLLHKHRVKGSVDEGTIGSWRGAEDGLIGVARVTKRISLDDVTSNCSLSMSSWMSQEVFVDNQVSMASVRSLHFHLERMRKLFDLSANILEMSQSKRLLVIYDDIVSRIRIVLDVEVQKLQQDVEGGIEMELESNEIPAQVTPPMSAAHSMHSLQDHGTSVSSTDDSSLDDYQVDDTPRSSLLTKPNLLWKVEKQRTDLSEMYQPCDVSFTHAGDLIVAEYDVVNDKNNKLRVFDQAGKSRGTIAQGEIKPLGVAVTREGYIVVTDCKGKRVKAYTETGQLIADIGKGQFGWPYGITANSKGQVIVTDAFNDTINIFASDGKKIKHFGASGSNSSQFRNPYHVTVDRSDNIVVSDSGNNCVKVFDCNGRFMFKTADIHRHAVTSFGLGSTQKDRKRRLKAPRGVCMELKGNMLVADDRNRVCIFGSDGKYVRNLLTAEDNVKFPEALSCSGSGHLAVTEWNPQNMVAVKVFNLYE